MAFFFLFLFFFKVLALIFKLVWQRKEEKNKETTTENSLDVWFCNKPYSS